MWSSDSVLVPTGMGKQSLLFCRHLGKNPEIDVKVLAWQYAGKRLNGHGEDIHEPFDLLPCMNKAYGHDMYHRYLPLEKPDTVVTLGDAWMVAPLAQMPRECQWIAYFPVDGAPLSQPIGNIISHANERVNFTYFGKHVTEQAGFDTNYIPHAFDPTIFKPLTQSEKDMMKEKIGWKDRFIFGVVSRPNPRKHLKRLFQAYGMLLRENPEMKKTTGLYLHMDVKDPMAPPDFMEDLNIYGIIDNVKFTNHPFLQGLSDEELNAIYNMFDVQCLPTGGEGFGVTMIEAGGAGIPTIATDYTTPREILRGGKCGILVPPELIVMEEAQVRKAWIDIQILKKEMRNLVDNPTDLRFYKRNLKKVMPYYHIDKVGPMMEELILATYGSNIKFTHIMKD